MSSGDTNRSSTGAYGVRKSRFLARTDIPDDVTFDYVDNGTNYKITFEDFKKNIPNAIGESNTSSNSGAGSGLALPKVGVDLPFKSLVGGTNVTLSEQAETITINATGGGSGESNTSSNSGGGAGLAQAKVGVDLPFKSLLQGSNITITEQADTVTIAATVTGEANTGANLGAGEGVFAQKSGVQLQFKSLVESGSITLTSDANTITIDSTGEANDLKNQGAGSALGLPKSGTDLPLKSLLAGSGINLTEQVDTVTIEATGGGAGEANTQTNQGAGAGLGLPKSGVDLPLKSIVQGTNISITEQADTITISAAGSVGEANTTSNQGGGEPLALTKSGVDLPFKTLTASGGVTLTPTADTLAIGVQLGLDSLTDVTVLLPADGQVLQYLGGSWINAALAISDISGLQPELDSKADLAGATFTGDVTVDTTLSVGVTTVTANLLSLGTVDSSVGSVTAPAFSLGAEATGLYLVAPGVLGIAIEGVLIATIDATNGIRTTQDLQAFQTLP